MSPALLLLGLSTPTGLHAFLADGDTLRDLGPALAVPGAHGWTRVEAVSQTVRDESVRALVTAPVGVDVPPRLLVPLDSCEGQSTETPTYVSDRLVTVASADTGYCGGAHPGTWAMHQVGPLGGPRDDAVSQFSAWLGDGTSASASFVNAATAARVALEGDHPDDSCFEVDGTGWSWGLVHERGRWRVHGYVGPISEACRGMELDFLVDVPVPAAAHAWDGPQIAPPLAAEDWVVAPDGSFRVELRKGAVVLVRGDVEVTSVAVDAQAIVQVDVATGEANVARWREEAPAAAARPVPTTPPMRFATQGVGGLLSWHADELGLHFDGGGVRVGQARVEVEGESCGWITSSEMLTIAPPTLDPGCSPADPDVERHVTLLAIGSGGVDYAVEGVPDEGESVLWRRHVPLADTQLRGDELERAGVPSRRSLPRKTRLTAPDGHLDVRCTAEGVELRRDGRRVDLSVLEDNSGDTSVPSTDAPVCTVLAIDP